MIYFAYGSNLCEGRLRRRAPSARLVGLAGHDLRFHKPGRDGSGKADAFATGESHHRVWGAGFEMTAADLRRLDEIEGGGYRRVEVGVECLGTVSTYLAVTVDPGLLPFEWYRTVVVNGARSRGLPEDYVERIAALSALVDDDRSRAVANLGDDC